MSRSFLLLAYIARGRREGLAFNALRKRASEIVALRQEKKKSARSFLRRPILAVVVRSVSLDLNLNLNLHFKKQGEFGNRDPTPGELESNFSDKVLGNWDTAHIIRGPAGLSKLVGLNTRDCNAERAALRLSNSDCVKLRNQVPGWRLQDDADTKEENTLLVRCWTVRDAAAGEELAKRAAALAEKEGHKLSKTAVASVSGLETVEVTLQTTALKALTENDFIVAAKLNEMGTADLEPPKKARFWA